MKRGIRMHEQDMVATCLCDVNKNEEVSIYDTNNTFLFNIVANDVIPNGNKLALFDIAKGTHVLKYGDPIGEAEKDIAKGKLVHVHNVKSLSVDIPPAFKKEIMRQMGIEE